MSYLKATKRLYFKSVLEDKFTDNDGIMINHIQKCEYLQNFPNFNNQFRIITHPLKRIIEHLSITTTIYTR